MQTAVIKKLAEVQAFVDLSEQIRQRGGTALQATFPEIDQQLADLQHCSLSPTSQRKVFEAKRLKTVAKLGVMMDLYIGDSWNDAIEILEWLSFYSGSASAHAALAEGAQADTNLAKTDQLFWELLISVKDCLKQAGEKLRES